LGKSRKERSDWKVTKNHCSKKKNSNIKKSVFFSNQKWGKGSLHEKGQGTVKRGKRNMISISVGIKVKTLQKTGKKG